MINLDEDALICDLAETYHIYDYTALPLKTAAVLAAGLRENSRIKMKAAGMPVDQDTILLAAIADRIEAFRLGFAKDPGKMHSFLEMLLGDSVKPKKRSNIVTFTTSDGLLAALKSKQKGAD